MAEKAAEATDPAKTPGLVDIREAIYESAYMPCICELQMKQRRRVLASSRHGPMERRVVACTSCKKRWVSLQ